MKLYSTIRNDGTPLPDVQKNQVMWDTRIKEYILLTNPPDGGIVLRVSVDHLRGRVSVAWTYRAVDPVYLVPLPPEREASIKAEFEAVFTRRKSSRFLGRI